MVKTSRRLYSLKFGGKPEPLIPPKHLQKLGFTALLEIVAHTEKTQAPDDIDQARVVGVVDHHKLGDLTSSTPLECWIRPVGCSNTIIKMMYDFYNVELLLQPMTQVAGSTKSKKLTLIIQRLKSFIQVISTG